MLISNPSPLCLVNGSVTTNGVNVSAGATVTIALADSAGVAQWNISCLYTDELGSAATVNGTLSVNLVTKTATFTAPASLGSALIFQSKVNNSYTTTFKIAVLTASLLRVAAFNETTEDNASAGWTGMFNSLVRNYTGSAASAGNGLTFSASAYNVVANADNTITVNPNDIQINPAFYSTSGQPNTLVKRDPSASGVFADSTGNCTYGGSIVPGIGTLFKIQHVTRASDIATVDVNIYSQAPYASATGSNRKPGNIFFDIPAPTNSGTVDGYVAVNVAGLNRIEFGRVNATGVGLINLPLGGSVTCAGTLSFATSGTTSPITMSATGNIALSSSTSVMLSNGANTLVEANATGVGFYGVAPVAQQTRAGQLTGTFGSTGTAISDVGASFNQTTLNNNFRVLRDAYNKLETIVHNLGLST